MKNQDLLTITPNWYHNFSEHILRRWLHLNNVDNLYLRTICLISKSTPKVDLFRSCQSVAWFLSVAFPCGWCIICSTLQALTGSLSYTDRGLHPSPPVPPPPSLHQCLLEQLKHRVGNDAGMTEAFKHFLFILTSCFMVSPGDFYAFQYRFYVFVNANCYQNSSKRSKLTPTWFEHATFWSGVRRATIAPRSPHATRCY